MSEGEIIKFRNKKGPSFYAEESNNVVLSPEQATIKAIKEVNNSYENSPYSYFTKNKKRYYLIVSILAVIVAIGLFAWFITILYRSNLK